MSTRQLLDPRWHLLRSQLEQIYLTMDADEKPVGLTLVSASSAGEMLTTTALEGTKELERRLVPDESAALRLGEDMMTASVSLSPEATA